MKNYNFELCESKHNSIDRTLEKIDQRIGRVENRFLALITGIVLNLLGVVGTLIILISRSAH